MEGETWELDDVPPGPYFHGSRHVISPGQVLRADEVDPTGGDERQRAFATISVEEALRWAWQRMRAVGDTLYVYEVEAVDAEVDINVHGSDRRGEPVTSVMAPTIRVVRLVQAMHETEFPDRWPWPSL